MSANQGATPEDKPHRRVFIYLQIHHVNSISTTEQTFKAKFYVRATWIQKKTTAEDQAEDQAADPFTWTETVESTHLNFDNAEDVVELENQSLCESKWRKVKDGPNRDNNLVVMEWSARGSGVFSHPFELTNYPCDTQLLKITLSSLDGSQLLDDCADEVRSTLRKDYIVHNEFAVDDELMHEYSVDKKKRDAKDEQVAKEKPVAKDEPVARGLTLMSQVEEFVINPIKKRPFHSISYIIPVRRYDHHVKMEVLHPVFFITLTAMASFVFPPDRPENRLTISITIALVMAGYSYVIVSYLPRTEEALPFANFVFYSFVFVFLVVIQNSAMALLYGNETETVDDNETVDSERFLAAAAHNLWGNVKLGGVERPTVDYITFLLLALAWLAINGTLYIKVFCLMRKDENERIENELEDLKTKRDELVKKFEGTVLFCPKEPLPTPPGVN